MPRSYDDEDQKAGDNSDWESDDGDNDDSDEINESEEDEDDEDNYDDDEDEGNDDDEDEDEQNRDEDEDEEDEEEDDKSNDDDEEEEGDDDDDDDDDDSYPDEETGLRFKDEDDDNELEAAPMEQNPYQDEPNDEEANKEKDRETTRKTLLACFLCCICLVVVACAIVLGVIFSKGSNAVVSATLAPVIPTPTPAPASASAPGLLTTTPDLLPTLAPWPTFHPTFSPAPTNASSSFPTYSPTFAPSMYPSISLEPTDPVRDELVLEPEEDTFIYTGGFTPGDAFGKEKTLLVQNGPKDVNEVPDAYALILFSLEALPQPWRITDRQPQALLRLTQVIRPDIKGLEPSNLTVVRLPATPLAVETLTGMMFAPYDGITGPSFIVNATQRRIEVDITSLIFGEPPFVPSRRQLQGKGSQLFIMIENQGLEQPTGGNRFASRESSTPPELYIGLFKPGAPRPKEAPTPSPTTSPQPSASAIPTVFNMTTNETTEPTFVSSASGPTSMAPVGTKGPTSMAPVSSNGTTSSAPVGTKGPTSPSPVGTKAPTITNGTAPPTKASIPI